ncbi:MAG: PAS domain S-box protein, partial [Candidatus Tenebribacter burtonii]|nr:PAS domain S-box protein [Candidatus Tenebribacter burtonii]
EEDLRESEKRFKHLVKNSNDIIVIIDEKANETYVNDSVEHITGFSPAELLGHSGFEFLHPDDVDNMSKTLSKLSKTPGGTIRSEYRHKRKDGGWVYLEAMGTNYLHDPSIKGIVLNIHDITERKKAQAKLIASEKEIRELATRWQTTFDAMSDSVSIIDLEGHILQYNSTTLTILKTTAKQIKLKKCWEIVHALSEPIDNCPTVRVKKSQHKESMEFQTDERWLNVAVDPIFDDTGKLKGAVHVVSNITEQKLAEVKLRESEAHYRQLFNMLPYGCEILDLKGNIIDCNLSTTKMLGYKRVDLIGKHIGNFIDAKTIKSFPQVFSRILKGETFSGEACQIHKNGSKINILRSGAQIVNSKGEIESVITLSVDITERKKAEVKLRESEERYRTIFEATGTAILIVDEETTVIQANRECERVTGYLASELVGKSWTKFVYEEDLLTMLKNAKARIKDPKSVSNKYEVRLINAKGEIRNTIISIGMISGSKRSIVSMIDMTERKQVEIALKKSENKLLATFGAMMDIIIVYDSDGYYLEIAPTNPANLSHSMQNLLGKSVTEVFPPEQADFFLQNIRLTLKTKQLTSVEYSLRIGDKDIWFSTLISPLSDNSVVWVARDITEKKQAEKNLKQRMQDLEIFNDVAVDREIMINDHRKEINELLEKLGEKTKYEIVE